MAKESSAPLRQTPLNAVHRAAGARMVAFHGWDMPVQFAGVIEEHLAVRTRAGLFDVSHMGEFWLRGEGVWEALQRLLSNDVSVLTDGRAQYTLLLNDRGGIIDDLLVYRISATEAMLCVNAGGIPRDLAWVRDRTAGVVVEDRSPETALLALQGPKAVEILPRVLGPEAADLAYYRFRAVPWEGQELLVSRTGYTGEDGFEVFHPAGLAETLWTRLLEAGASDGLQPVGLGARDTLRLEAGYLLSGQDMDESVTPLEARLGWVTKLEKGDFTGREALRRLKAAGPSRKLAGLEMVGRGIARHGYPLSRDGQRIGEVTSGSFAPFLKKNIGLGYLPPALTGPGTEVAVEIRGKAVGARVVPLPFYQRPKG